jgi:hypothetical protein
MDPYPSAPFSAFRESCWNQPMMHPSGFDRKLSFDTLSASLIE